MRELVEGEQRAKAKVDKALVRPGFREHIEQLMRSQWREPVIVLRLDEKVALGFDVPGRRRDGTVKGKGLAGRFFWNIGRGVAGVGINLFSLFGGGGVGNPFKPEIRVSGPANAMALDLLDRIRPARGPWLVCSPSRLAIVDAGSTYTDPAGAPAPQVLWQAQKPRCPEISFRTHTITWPDGSTFKFPLHGQTEVQHLRKYYEFPDIIHWQGRPAN
jgi:hypothetical protein